MYEYHDINYPNNIYPVEHDNFYGGDEYEENDYDLIMFPVVVLCWLREENFYKICQKPYQEGI